MNAVMKSLHMCGNSLSFAAAFSLDCLGGPKFTELVSYLKSCNIRASLKTITGFEWMHHELLRHAVSELPLGRHRYKLAIPKGWDAPAFCTNLYLASTHPCVSLLQPPIGKYSLQAIIYKALVCSEEQSQQAWLKLIQSRALLFRDWSKTYLSSLGSSSSSSSSSASASSSSSSSSSSCLSSFPFSLVELLELRRVLKTLQPGPRMLAIKTLLNSWSTSKRLHEPKIHRCLVCGSFQDDLPHYLVCNTFWDLLCCAAKLDKSFLDLPPLHRCGLCDPSSKKLLLIACAFRVYHAIKFQHLELALSAHAPGGDPSPLFDLILHLAEFHLKELKFHCVINL